MAFIRPSRNAFTSEQSAAVESVAKAFFSNETRSKPADVFDAYRTRPCAYGPNCNRGDTCTYANDSAKLVPVPCRFDAKCFTREFCRRFHTGQTMDEYITVNNFTWPEKKQEEVKVLDVESSADDVAVQAAFYSRIFDEVSSPSDHSFVIQIDEKSIAVESDSPAMSAMSDDDLIESEIQEVCDEIQKDAQKREMWDELEAENYRLGRTEYDEEFDNFVDYCEAVYAYQKTLEKLYEESEYAQYQYAEFIHGSQPI